MASSRELPLLFLLVVARAAIHAAAAVPVPAPAQAQEYCGDSLAGLMECRSFVFGGAAAPSRACCAAYGAVYASDDDHLCLCYVDDGTFWRAAGYDVDYATGDSFQIPERCGQVGPPIEFWCEESGQLPPYGPQGTPPAQPPAAAAATPMAQPPAPSGSSSVATAPTFTSPPPPPPPTSKAKRHSSPELLMLLVAIAAVCSII
uniref:Bifunctional inhibitor/plant lipid transfer protein/seed storage helical domain-containing protein n=1 Tax=Setaria italica TaxID=4555 RepID=K3ZM40_SETIT